MTDCMVISLQTYAYILLETGHRAHIYDNLNGVDEEKTVGISIKQAYGSRYRMFGLITTQRTQTHQYIENISTYTHTHLHSCSIHCEHFRNYGCFDRKYPSKIVFVLCFWWYISTRVLILYIELRFSLETKKKKK